jgi:hypothetical protein
MRGAVVLSVTSVLLGLAPPDCGKLLGKKRGAQPVEAEPPPPPPAPPPPPVWNPPEAHPAPPVVVASAPPPSPELAKAQAAAAAHDWKKVKALLEKRARAGKASPEEVQLAHDACEALKDKACLDALAKLRGGEDR